MNPVTAFLIVFLLSLIAFATFGLEFALASATSTTSQSSNGSWPTTTTTTNLGFNPTFAEAIIFSLVLGIVAGGAEYGALRGKELKE